MNQNKEMGSRHAKRPCKLCIDKNAQVDYKDIANLQRFISEDGKILPRHLTGNCAEHQSQVTLAIKRCREIAL